jgi:hypothetical protein
MNIDYTESSQFVAAKTCGCKRTGKQRVTYSFSEEFHGLCKDKKDILQAEIGACAKLLMYASDDSEKAVIEKEITELKMALDLMT